MRRRSLGESLIGRAAFVLMLNAIPIMLALSIAWLHRSGEIEFAPGSETLVPLLAALGVAIAVLILLAGFIGPVQVAALRRLTKSDEDSSLEGVRRVAAFLFGPTLYLGAMATLLLVVVDIAAIVYIFWHFTLAVLRLQAGG